MKKLNAENWQKASKLAMLLLNKTKCKDETKHSDLYTEQKENGVWVIHGLGMADVYKRISGDLKGCSWEAVKSSAKRFYKLMPDVHSDYTKTDFKPSKTRTTAKNNLWRISDEVILALRSEETIDYAHAIGQRHPKDYVEVIRRPQHAGGDLYAPMRFVDKSQFADRYYSYLTNLRNELFNKLIQSSEQVCWEIDLRNAVPQCIIRQIRERAIKQNDATTVNECEEVLELMRHDCLIKYTEGNMKERKNNKKSLNTLIFNIFNKKADQHPVTRMQYKQKLQREDVDVFAKSMCRVANISYSFAQKIFYYLKGVLAEYGRETAVDLLFEIEKIMEKFVIDHLRGDPEFGEVSEIVRKHDALFLWSESEVNELKALLDSKGIVYKEKKYEPTYRPKMTSRKRTISWDELKYGLPEKPRERGQHGSYRKDGAMIEAMLETACEGHTAPFSDGSENSITLDVLPAKKCHKKAA